jgi:hypothetical protein
LKENRDSERGSKIVRKATESLRTARRDFEPLQFGVLEMNFERSREDFEWRNIRLQAERNFHENF